MTRRWALCALAASLALAACDAMRDPVTPTGPDAPTDAAGPGGPRYLSLIDTTRLVIPYPDPDPFPGAKGYWLGSNVTPGRCYAKHNPNVVDRDKDWLDDNCEYQLAFAFRPYLYIHPFDACPDGEPYWAVKLFDDQYWGGGDMIRIAYMPAYYSDCGAFGHAGDSEFIRFTIDWDHRTRHWVLVHTFLSAHDGKLTEASSYNGWEEMFYPDGSQTRRAPKVYVARDKHANYRSHAACDWAAFTYDECAGVYYGRMAILTHRNAGSRHVDFFPGGARGEGQFRTSFVEYFYTKRDFRGWNMVSQGVKPYHDWLNSLQFETWEHYTGGPFPIQILDKGPGPEPPFGTSEWALALGPGAVPSYTAQSWRALVEGVTYTQPQYEWRRTDLDPVLPRQTVLVGTGASYTPYVSQCEDFVLELKTHFPLEYFPRTLYDTLAVDVQGCTPPFSASISGPWNGTAGQLLTYYASVSGSSGYRYEWWLREAYGTETYLAGTGQSLQLTGPWQNTDMELVLLVFDGQGRRVRAQQTIRITYQEPGDGTCCGGKVPPPVM